MAGNTRRKPEPKTAPKRRRAPARSPEEREQQLIALTIDLTERQIIDGTVSAQVQSHYLKLASKRSALEDKRLEHENELLQAKVKDLENNSMSSQKYEEAIRAMRTYQTGVDDEEDYYDD